MSASMLTASQDWYTRGVSKHPAQRYHHLPLLPCLLLVTSDVPKPSFQVSHENGLENVCLKEVRDFSSSIYCLSVMPRIWQRRIDPIASKAVVHSATMCACMFACCVCSGCINTCNLILLANRFSEF